ncbi:hypothetical protein JCM10207_007683 [Rhodosporidiobolus poonsookiae]
MPRKWHGHKRRDDDEDEDDTAQLQAQPDDLVKPPGIEPFGPSPPFNVLVGLYEAFETATREKHKKAGYKGDILSKFFTHWREHVGPDLYPLVRLLMPDRDTRRKTYNLKEAKLARAIITALDLPTKNDSSLKLMNWKTPTKDDPGAGEFASVAYEVIKTRSTVISSRPEVTIEFINDVLNQLSMRNAGAAPGTKPQTEHARILKVCVQKLTATEMKWLIRIILRDLKIGVGEKTIFNQLHPDAMDVFNTCSDIKRVCWRLHNPNERIVHEDWTVTPGNFFRPMLSWRALRQLSDITKAMKRGRPRRDAEYQWKEGEYRDDEFIMEEKLDGERLQLHKMGDNYMYGSRKAKDYTYLYGSDRTKGSLTPFLSDVFRDDIEDIILDGEMLVWDPNLNKYMPFGNLKTFALAKTEHIGKHDPRPCFKVFDILYIKGRNGAPQPLLEWSLWKRKKLLAEVLTEKKGIIEIADCATGKNVDEIRAYLGRILQERGEGLVIKHPLSVYSLGGREDTWIKLKPEYMDALGENIDGVVVGGYWGQGRRGGILASYMIGLRGKYQGHDVYFSFAKIGSGLSRSDYASIQNQYQDKFEEFDRSSPPSWFRTVSEWPDVLIKPENSFVIEVKAAEIVGGVDYGSAMTLRFPRAIRIRTDKTWEDAMDFEDVRTLRTGPQKRSMGDDLHERKVKSARTTASKKARSVSTAVGKIDVNSAIFDGLIFYIHSATPSLKSELEKKVHENGGKCIQTIPPAEVKRVVVASRYEGIKNKKGGKTVDVLKPDWINESIEKSRRMPLYKRFFLHATDETQALREYSVDEEAEDLLMAVSEEEEELMIENPSQSGTPEGSPDPIAYREPARNYGEEAADSEDEPQTDHDSASDGDDDDEVDEAGFVLLKKEDDGASTQGTVASAVGDLRLDSVPQEPMPQTETQASEATMVADEAKPAAAEAVKPAEAVEPAEADEADPMRPFAHFVAYFDTQAAAESNGLPQSKVLPRIQHQADNLLDGAKEAFVAGGGTATDDLNEPALTHLIVTKLVPDRYKELVSRTAEPAYRRIVTHDWVEESVDESTPLDETDYKP